MVRFNNLNFKMTTSPRNKLSIVNSKLHANYFCSFCGENSYNDGTIKSCIHLKYIWRERDGQSENALIYVTDDVRKYLEQEDVDHFQIWEVLCLEPPFEDTFVIEEKFGFNKTKIRTFVSDIIIDLVTTAVVTFSIIFISLWIISALGTFWWLWLWGFFSSVIILMSALAPLLQQLKNKFYPLEDKKLKVSIEKLLTKCGFESKGLFIMNGSLRSSHGNAFFGGFGKTKRIIFFDTLLEKLTHKEIEAVIAHELGHFKMNHVKKFMAIMITILFITLYLLGGLKDNPLFYEVLGVTVVSDANFLLLFNFVLLNYLFFFIKPLMTSFSRKNEYEADAYACLFTKPDDLKHSLTKLYRDNASTLTPDPLYSFFNHSHPPALMRIEAISKL